MEPERCLWCMRPARLTEGTCSEGCAMAVREDQRPAQSRTGERVALLLLGVVICQSLQAAWPLIAKALR